MSKYPQLETSVKKFSGFADWPDWKRADAIAYLLIERLGHKYVGPGLINKCLKELKYPEYSRIASYISDNSKKPKKRGVKQKYNKEERGYSLTQWQLEEWRRLEGNPEPHKPTDDLFPMELFQYARGYIKTIAAQAAGCYDKGWYDACLVMVRRIVETLIIECYEAQGSALLIKDENNDFLPLSKLIEIYKDDTSINPGRTAKKGLAEMKKQGDLCAHNRKYTAKKPDVDNHKGDFRIAIEELLRNCGQLT